MTLTDTLRRDNAKHVATINKAWGHRVAWLEDEPGFEIKSPMVDGLYHKCGRWVPPFKTLSQVRAEAQ